MTKKHYKVVCPEVNLILLIKKLTFEEEQKTYNSIKRKITQLKKPVTIDSYMVYLLNSFLDDSEGFFDSLPEDSEERELVIKAVYEAIIQAYPPFDINFICTDINNGTFLEDITESVGAVLAQSIKAFGEEKPTKLKSINTLEDIRKVDSYITKNLVGQEEAVSSVVNSLKLIAAGLYQNASFFFIGPTGVGKTELARLLGDKYSGNFWKINCAEYANAHEYAKLIGSPPGYVGHTDSSIMAEKAEKSNRWVILFDEIEKAHHKFYDFLLSLLDDGSCTDNMGRVLDFSESIFIFTSNQGVSDVGSGRRVGFTKDVVSVSSCKEQITDSVKKKFPAEFMNRIDNYVFFNSLSKEDVREIAKIALKSIPIKKHKALLDFIVSNGYSEEYGARNIKRFIKNDVAPVIAQALLERKVPEKLNDLYTPKIVHNKLQLGKLRGMDDIDQAAG